jgi:hypothetical protein
VKTPRRPSTLPGTWLREHGNLIGVLEELSDEGIDPTGEAARNMLLGIGVPEATINAIFAQFDRIQRNYEGRRFKTTITAPFVPLHPDTVRGGQTSHGWHLPVRQLPRG